MAKIETYTCDICHIQKKQTNHWWVAYSVDKSLHFHPFDGFYEDFEKSKVTNGFHLCGIECSTKWLGQQQQGAQQ